MLLPLTTSSSRKFDRYILPIDCEVAVTSQRKLGRRSSGATAYSRYPALALQIWIHLFDQHYILNVFNHLLK
jgi:hypothetical protein